MKSSVFLKCLKNLSVKRFSSRYSVERKPSVRWKEPVGFKTNVKVYNPIIKDKSELVTQRENVISWYSCGPTVYDSPHLGHACCYLHFDIIRRILEDVCRIDVMQVMNVTDIDDKIIRRSQELNISYKAIAVKYEEEFFEQLSQLGIRRPSVIARVSEHVPEILEFVETISRRGFGYSSNGSVNFLTEKYSNYGKLHHVQDELNPDVDKSSNRDFALWKGVKPGEPFWDSPWGPGRPGWHVECSAIASKYLGTPIDVHSGGVDLQFPHHENEEAQSCVYHETEQWVNYWIHAGHLHLQDQKMSKSLKNVVSLQDFLEEYSPDHLRMLCLLIPYRNRVEYSDKVMTNAVAVFDKFTNFFSGCKAYVDGNFASPGRIHKNTLLQELDLTKIRVTSSLLDDFDTSSAIAHLLKLVHLTNSMLNDKSDSPEPHQASTVLIVSSYIQRCLEKLGCLSFNEVTISGSLDLRAHNLAQSAVEFRSQIRDLALQINKNDSQDLQDHKSKLLSFCDSFRDNLKTVGVDLKDQGKKSTWSVKR